MQPFYYLLTLACLVATPLLIFAMKYFASAYEARAKTAVDDAYRELAHKAAAAQSANGASLLAIQSELAEIKARVANVETILKAVE